MEGGRIDFAIAKSIQGDVKLKYAKKHSDLGDLVSIDRNTQKGSALNNPALTGTLMSLVSSKSAGNLLLTLAPMVLSFVSGKKKKKFVSSVLKEVLGGYIKYKISHMVFRYIKMMIKKKKK